MSTRCILKFYAEFQEVIIYRHTDGYPSEIIPDLTTLQQRINFLLKTQGFSLHNLSRLTQFLIKLSEEYQPHSTIPWDAHFLYYIQVLKSGEWQIIVKETEIKDTFHLSSIVSLKEEET